MLSACGGARSPNHSGYTIIYTVTGNSSIYWQAPTSYTDLTPISLSEIGGYYIYVGTDENNMQFMATISGSTVTEFSLANLDKGIHYIAITCYNMVGIESTFSSLIVVDII